MANFTFSIDMQSSTPIYMQIYHYIRQEIEEGRLEADTRLPSTRGLAKYLFVSRNTIDMAYGQLLDEGYIEARPKRGYFVNDLTGHVPTLFSSQAPTLSSSESPKPNDPDYLYNFAPDGVDLEAFPYPTWKKTMKDILSDDRNNVLFLQGDSKGEADFRATIASYLHQARGVNCSPEQIIVGAGADYLLLLLAQLLGHHITIAMEDPAYKQAWRIFNAVGLSMCGIPLDGQGMNLTALNASEASVAYVTPSHHFPLGVVMPIQRRLKLLEWARAKEDRYIIEDDYNGEFRYKGKPIPALQGIDQHEKVIYMGTFSKAIAPSLRIGYLVLPKPLLKRYESQFSFYANTVPRMDQRLMNDFMVKGHFDRHLNRMRTIYKSKRDYILNALSPYSTKVSLSGENAGLHLLLTFKTQHTEAELIQLAASVNIKVYGLSGYYIHPPAGDAAPTLILGYATLTESQLQESLALLLPLWFNK